MSKKEVSTFFYFPSKKMDETTYVSAVWLEERLISCLSEKNRSRENEKYYFVGAKVVVVVGS